MPSNHIFPIIYFALLINSITLLLTLQQTILKLYIRPINLIGLILLFFFLFTAFLTLYIREKKGAVPIIFNGPSTAYKPNYSYYHYFFLYFPPSYTAYINPAATACINPAATARINPATTCYIPPDCGAARS